MVAIRVLQLGAAAGPGPSPAPTQQAGAHDPRAQEEAMAAEARLWEDDPECAFICTHFDPAQGDRRMLVCNQRQADLLGMHKEEVLARFARREVYVPFVPADWLANFVHDLDYGDEPRTYRFLRMVTRVGGTRRAVLVQNTKVKVFDSSGRVSRVAAPPALAIRMILLRHQVWPERRGPSGRPSISQSRAAAAPWPPCRICPRARVD